MKNICWGIGLVLSLLFPATAAGTIEEWGGALQGTFHVGPFDRTITILQPGEFKFWAKLDENNRDINAIVVQEGIAPGLVSVSVRPPPPINNIFGANNVHLLDLSNASESEVGHVWVGNTLGRDGATRVGHWALRDRHLALRDSHLFLQARLPPLCGFLVGSRGAPRRCDREEPPIMRFTGTSVQGTSTSRGQVRRRHLRHLRNLRTTRTTCPQISQIAQIGSSPGGGITVVAAQLAAGVSPENMPALLAAIEQLALNPLENSALDWSAVLAALAGM